MRDGVELAADLYLPGGEPAGTLLVRGPYGRGLPHSVLMARVWARHGYRVLFVSSRGTFGSGGEFDPMRTEAQDGQDVVAWMREQPWFTGTFATLGLSYLGHTQWALFADPPPELAAAVIAVAPHDFARHTWGTGALNQDLLEWSDMVAHQEDGGVAALRSQATRAQRLRPVFDGLPLADVADAHLAGRAPWYRERVTRPDLDDPYWAPTRHGDALDRITVPVLLHSGWLDLFAEQTMQQYARLRERGVDVALTVGPWTHVELVGKGARTTTREALDWLDEHLARRGGRRRPAPVRVYITGADEWRDLLAWPPATTPLTLHPWPGGGLVAAEPPVDGAPSSFTFDPADPTPTLGGPTLAQGGAVDDGPLAARPDVLAFTGAPLERDLDVLGAPRVELDHATDNPHADLFVRLSDVDRKGRSRNISEAYLRLDPARGSEPVVLALRDTAHRFRAGHRVRLLVAGGSHPQFARNLGTGEPQATGTRLLPCLHTVRHGAGGTTRLVLPTADA
jgi:hypothetical protein